MHPPVLDKTLEKDASAREERQSREPFDLAITGIGLVTPLGIGCDENLGRLRETQSAIDARSVSAVDSPALPLAAAGQIDFGNSLRLPKNEKYMVRSVRIAMQAALEAVRSSGIRESPGFNPESLAIYTGSGQTGLEYQDFFQATSYAWRGDREQDFKYLGGRASRLLDPYFSLKTLSNAALALISAEVEARGPSANYVHSDTAAAAALQAACYDLMEGRCDAAIAGGYECLLVPAAIHAFRDAGLLLDTNIGDAMRPFDRNRNGIALGEAACFFVLERKADAKARGAEILGEIVDVELTMDSAGSRRPSVVGDRIQTAFRDTTACIGELDFVVAHGLGTPEHDRCEAQALARCVKSETSITAFKGLTGYVGAATAAVELGLGLLSARNGFIPPVARLESPEATDLRLITGEPMAMATQQPTAAFLASSWVGQVSVIIARTRRVH
jgi:3-oxoacyl-[acyl-carrier-protein] synthase II